LPWPTESEHQDLIARGSLAPTPIWMGQDWRRRWLALSAWSVR